MKKGQNSTLMVIAIILAVGLIMISFAVSFGKNLKEHTRGDDCNKQIVLKTMTTVEKGYGMIKYEGISAGCPIYEVNIEPGKTTIYKKQKKFTTINYDSLDEEEVYYVLAEEMRHCWRQFGSGELDAFWYPEGFLQNLFGKDEKTGCRVCSTITFDSSVPTAVYHNLTGYLKTTEYLSKNRVDEGGEEQIQTYYHYLAEKKRYCADEYLSGENCWEEFANKTKPSIANPEISTDKTYHAVFIRRNLGQKEGTLNTYLLDEYQLNDYRLCQVMLPFSE